MAYQSIKLNTDILDKFAVWRIGNWTPSVVHDTLEEAKNEAVRLSNEQGGTYFVLKVKAYFTPTLLGHEHYHTSFSKYDGYFE